VSWQAVGLTALWLVFLPNSFYLVSDLIHLRPTGQINILYDVVLFQSFIFNSFIAGLASLYMIHRLLLKRKSESWSHALIALAILASSFAIYLGRYLRWNSWDLALSPVSLLYDVSEQLINPFAQPQVLATTLTFFMLISSTYVLVWVVLRDLHGD
jgi:uncharacterized membrane protein